MDYNGGYAYDELDEEDDVIKSCFADWTTSGISFGESLNLLDPQASASASYDEYNTDGGDTYKPLFTSYEEPKNVFFPMPDVGANFDARDLSFEQIEAWGLLEGIPRKDEALEYVPCTDETRLCAELLSRGYDIRLGETGRARLKREISQRLKDSSELREKCIRHVCRLKNANVYQLIQMAEITGCLTLALKISAAYWSDYARKQPRARKAAPPWPYAPPPDEMMLSPCSSSAPPSDTSPPRRRRGPPSVSPLGNRTKRQRTAAVPVRKKTRPRKARADATWRPKNSRWNQKLPVAGRERSTRMSTVYAGADEAEILREVILRSLHDAYAPGTEAPPPKKEEEEEEEEDTKTTESVSTRAENSNRSSSCEPPISRMETTDSLAEESGVTKHVTLDVGALRWLLTLRCETTFT